MPQTHCRFILYRAGENRQDDADVLRTRLLRAVK